MQAKEGEKKGKKKRKIRIKSKTRQDYTKAGSSLLPLSGGARIPSYTRE